jgi:methyl-accepting chemotaxis protein
LGIVLFGLGARPVSNGIEGYTAARRLVVLSAASHNLFEALQNLRNERGNLLSALSMDGPITDALAKTIYPPREAEDAAYDAFVRDTVGLDLPGFADSVAQLRIARQALLDARPKADADARRPKTQREAGFAPIWTEIGGKLLAALGATTDIIDAAIRLHDPVIDALLAVKRAAWATRNFAGVQALAGSTAIASGKPWTAAQILQVTEARGHEDASWSTVSEFAARPDAPRGLQAAYAIASNGFFGKDRNRRQSIFDALASGRLPDISADDWVGFIVPSLGNINLVASAALSDMSARAQQGETDSLRTCVVNIGVLALSLALVLTGLFVVNKRISQPLRSLTRSMRRLAERDFTIDLPATKRQDELGEMIEAVRVFRENGVAMQRLEAEAAEQRRLAETQRAAAAAVQLQATAAQKTVVDGVASGLLRLADGDLTCTLNTPFAPEYERLRNDFNAAVAGLREVMQSMLQHSGAIRSGTAEIASAADELARRTEQQAASLKETAIALDEITATVSETANSSGRARSVAEVARAEAEASDKVVREAVAAMGEIEGSARQIGQIIGVIDEIAFQTNLLALNAGVEAARAGDAGRGFAVVASEVRALAQRAADAAKEIKALITMSMKQVERGVDLVGQTGETLGRIRGTVSQINVSIVEIAASAQKQSTGLVQVNTAINQMGQVTQRNTAMVEESTAATRSLFQETEELNEAMNRFRIAS